MKPGISPDCNVLRCLLVFLIVSFLLIGSVFSQDSSAVYPLKHEKRIYVDESGTLYVPEAAQTYLHISMSPDDSTKSIPLYDEKSKENASPLQLSEGKNTFRNPLSGDSESQQYLVYADGSAPSTTANFEGSVKYSSSQSMYYGPNLAFSLTSFDQLSGVQGTYLSRRGDEFSLISELSFDFTSDAKHHFQFYSVDNVGNVEAIKSTKFFVDVTPPLSEFHVKGIFDGTNLSSSATIALSSTDNLSGVRNILYRIDEGEEMIYGREISVEKLSDGEHTLQFHAVDNVDNVGERHVYAFYHDSTPPEIVLSIEGDKDVTEHTVFVSGKTSISLSTFDNRPGATTTYFQVDQDSQRIYTKQFDIPNESGIHKIGYFAVDKVQNMSKRQVKRVYMDLTAPETDYDATGTVFWNVDTIIVTKETKISLVTSDMESGIKEIRYGVNDNNGLIYDKPISFESDGNYRLTYFAIDRVNNREKPGELWIRVDNSPKLTNAVTPELKHRKLWIEAEGKGLMGSTGLPFYLKISASPDDTARSFLLDMSSLITKDTQPMYFDRMGTNVISVKATAEPVSFRVNIDGEAPKSSSKFTGAKKFKSGGNTYFGPGLIVDLEADDNRNGIRSGLQKILFSIDGSEFGLYQQPLDFFSREKVYKLLYNSVDSVGNTEEIHETEFIVDITSPKTKHVISGSYYGNTFSSRTIVTLSTSDNLCGTKNVFYHFDEEDQRSYNKPLSSTSFQNLSEGSHTLSYHSVDNVGNVEKTKSLTFILDHSPPGVVYTLLGDKSENNNLKFVHRNVRIRLTASEQETGVQSINYQINGGKSVAYTSAFQLPETGSKHTISFSSTDLSGNTSNRQTEVLYLDLAPPETRFRLDGVVFQSPNQLYVNSETQLVLSSIDKESGVRQIQHRFDNGKPVKYSNPLQIARDGLHEIEYWATDRVKNREEISSFELFVDNKPPDIDITYSGGAKTGKNGEIVLSEDDMIYISTNDDFTGVERVVYKINDGKEKLYRKPLTNFRAGKNFKIDVIAFDQVSNRSQKSITIRVE
ncbi:MAG: hypothetical protein HN356_06965 [Calditrichaeota bacterium]|nr:hypothetical protein [Calditrichota bacterium]